MGAIEPEQNEKSTTKAPFGLTTNDRPISTNHLVLEPVDFGTGAYALLAVGDLTQARNKSQLFMHSL